MKFNVVARFRETIPTVKSVSSSEIYKNSGFSTEITVLSFLRKSGFFGVSHVMCPTLRYFDIWLAMYHPTLIASKNVKFQLSQNSMKFAWVTRFRVTNLVVKPVSSFEIYKISRFSTCIVAENYCFVFL